MGTVTLLAKKLRMEDLYLHTLGTRREGWQPVLYYLFYVYHTHRGISRCPGDGGSYDTPFTDQLPHQPPYSVCQEADGAVDLTKAEVPPI